MCVCARAQYWVALAALCVRLCACLLVSYRKGEAAVRDVKQSELSSKEQSSVRLCMHMFWMDMACMDTMWQQGRLAVSLQNKARSCSQLCSFTFHADVAEVCASMIFRRWRCKN
jgi:uncharacterized protein YcfL